MLIRVIAKPGFAAEHNASVAVPAVIERRLPSSAAVGSCATNPRCLDRGSARCVGVGCVSCSIFRARSALPRVRVHGLATCSVRRVSGGRALPDVGSRPSRLLSTVARSVDVIEAGFWAQRRGG